MGFGVLLSFDILHENFLSDTIPEFADRVFLLIGHCEDGEADEAIPSELRSTGLMMSRSINGGARILSNFI